MYVRVYVNGVCVCVCVVYVFQAQLNLSNVKREREGGERARGLLSKVMPSALQE